MALRRSRAIPGASINTAMPGRPRPWTPNKLHGGVWLVGRGEMFERFGGPGGIRTLDLFHAMEARSQLRHRPTSLFQYSTGRRQRRGRLSARTPKRRLLRAGRLHMQRPAAFPRNTLPAPRTRRPAHELRQPRLLRAPVHVFVATDPDCTPSIGNAGCSAPAGGTCRGQQLSLATRRLRTQAGSRGGQAACAAHSPPCTPTPARRLLRAPVHVFVAPDPACTPSIGNARCSAPAGGKCRFGRPALQRAPPAHARSVSR